MTSPAATPPGKKFRWEVVATQTVTYTAVVYAEGAAEAGSMVGDQLRAEDYTGLNPVHRVINNISMHRIDADADA